MPVIVEIMSGPSRGTRLEVSGELTVGREADVSLPDPDVAANHAILRVRGGSVEIEDLGSPGGTWVDGRRIDGPRALGDGASLRIGQTELRLELVGSAAARPPAAGERRASRVDAAESLSARSRTVVDFRAVQDRAARTRERRQAPQAPALSASERAGAGPLPHWAAAPKRPRVASRLWMPAAASFAVIALTTVALVVYFALR